MSDTYDRKNGMQSATRQNEPAPRPTVAPGKRTLTQGLSRGDTHPRVPVQQKRAPMNEETRERDEAARRQRDAEIQRSLEMAVRPDLFPGSLEHEAGEDPSSAPVVQQESTRASQATAPDEDTQTHELAAAGVVGGGGALPHLHRIQDAFGHHDVSGVQAHIGGPATEASDAMGATAYATGDRVAFAGAPDLHTAAHEAAHVVQQRASVSLPGGVGQAGDAYEQHADAVADRVVRGESAADLLDQGASSGAAPAAPAVQRRSVPGSAPAATPGAAPATASPGPARSRSACQQRLRDGAERGRHPGAQRPDAAPAAPPGASRRARRDRTQAPTDARGP
jgi:Domain of unknown function (DUF4157)